MSPPTATASQSTQWHAVSPQTRPLSIAILELAPTSVTLALTRSPPSTSTQSQTQSHLPLAQHIAHSHPHSHAHPSSHSHSHTLPNSSNAASQNSSHGHGKKKKHKKRSNTAHHASQDSDEDGGDGDDGDVGPGSHGAIPGAYPYSSLLSEGQTFKDMLSHGVVVTIDGAPWSRIVAHVSEDGDDEDSLAMVNGASGLGAADDHDEEGDWEDEWEHAGHEVGMEGAEEGLGSASGNSGLTTTTRRRRVRGRSAGPGENMGRERGTTRPSRTTEGRPDRSSRWDRERAVVVVYDLDPAKEHELELQIVGLAGEVKDSLVPVSNAVLIPPVSPSSSTLHPRSRANSLRSRSRPRSRSNSINAPTPSHAGPSPLGSEVPSSPNHPTIPMPDMTLAVPTSILSPHDAQTAQIRHMIAAAHGEREHLQMQIKEARKTAQRSEAAIRTEIETTKKNNEKAGGNDQRNKQKFLALQEQVKQGWAGAEAANTDADDVKNGLGDLEARLTSILLEVEGVREEWKRVKEREEEARELDKKNRADEEKRLIEINAKIDKVRARKEKKDAERVELEKKLEALQRAREEVERKTEEEKHLRRAGYYPSATTAVRWDQQQAVANDYAATYGERTLTAHPSLSNLGSHSSYAAGPAYRPRGGASGYQPRFPSAGSRPAGAVASSSTHGQPSPTQGSSFYSIQHPVAPGSASPTFHPGALKQPAGGKVAGTNPTAVPFHPSSLYPSPPNVPPVPGAAPFDPVQHTALMPPQLQHRIYLPNVRPRPTPNFHPPPSVLAEQAAQQAATSSSGSSSASSSTPASSTAAKPSPLSAPSFPPLPSQSVNAGGKQSPSAPGPSLASIVTRAVLSPSALAAQGMAGGHVRPPQGSLHVISPTTPTYSTSAIGGGTGTSPMPGAQHRNERVGDFPPLSPIGMPLASPPRTTPSPGAAWGGAE